MKKYLITGCAGFIGSNFVYYMLKKYEDILLVNLDKLTYAGNLENLKGVEGDSRHIFVQGDICDKELVAGLFEKYDFDYVINFAAESHVDRSIANPEIFVQTNVMGTVNLLQRAKEAWYNAETKIWKDGKKYIQVSTDEVYGALGAEGYFMETTPLSPHSPYSSSKASADHFVMAFHDTYGMPINITRCSNNYGPYQFPEKLIPLMINNVKHHKQLPVYGDGMQIRDWLYVEDHCKAIDMVANDGKEGHEYTAEQVYAMLPKNLNKKGNNKKGNNKSPGSAVGRAKKEISKEQHQPVRVWDDHSRWGKYEEDDTLRDVWVKRFEDAAEAIKIRDPSNARGLLPAFAERILKELKKTQTDWRTILNDFIQEEVVDYSFAPPDRRFDDSPFFLPDFNGKEDRVEDILFMIDTSGSMSDDMIAAAYSEVKGAIDQFNGKLKGWLGFFDAAIIKPQPFSDENEFKIIKPAGGGGTDFQIIFEYVFHHMSDKLPASIIILSDGYAPFPLEKLAGGIPVLWLLNNEEVNPPWGKVARITV